MTQTESKPRDLNVLIAYPTHGHPKDEFCVALARMMTFFATLPYDGKKNVDVTYIGGSNICENRTRLVSAAFEKGATHILFYDNDINAPADTIPRLLNSMNSWEKSIIGVNYPTKEIRSRPTAYADRDDYVGPVWTKPDSKGLEEVAALGFGCVMIDTRVFAAMELPFFEMRGAPPDHVTTVTEDVFFCRKARELGYKIWVDHDLSKQVTHVGSWSYNWLYANKAEETNQAIYRGEGASIGA